MLQSSLPFTESNRTHRDFKKLEGKVCAVQNGLTHWGFQVQRAMTAELPSERGRRFTAHTVSSREMREKWKGHLHIQRLYEGG